VWSRLEGECIRLNSNTPKLGKGFFNPFPPSKYFQQEETTKRQVKTKLPISSQLSQTSGSVDMHAKTF